MPTGWEGVSKDEMARLILGIEPANEPECAHKAVDSLLACVRWTTKVGCRYMVAGQYPGAERDRGRPFDLLQSLCILTTRPGGRTGRCQTRLAAGRLAQGWPHSGTWHRLRSW